MCPTHTGTGPLPAPALGGLVNLREREPREAEADWHQTAQKTLAERPPRKKNKPEKKQFKGPNVAWRNPGAGAAATREDIFCISFGSSMELPQSREGGHTHPRDAPIPVSMQEAPASQTCQQPKELLLLQVLSVQKSKSSPSLLPAI